MKSTIALERTAVSVHELLVNEEDARACRDIDEAACRQSPRNFGLLLGSYVLTKLGDAVLNPKTVLPWVMSGIGAPAALTAVLVPIRESGSLVPQLGIAAWVRRQPVRKWLWVAGAVVQGFAVGGIGLAALALDGLTGGLSVVALLGAFSLARGLCSVASKDVIGKTIPKQQRGQLTGWSTSLAGLIAIVAGVVAVNRDELRERPELVGFALLGAALLWWLASWLFAMVDERPGETDGGENAVRRAFSRLGILASDRPFRRFVITRALLMCSALSAPFFVLLAGEYGGVSGRSLGLFVIAGGIASLLGAPVWGRWSDRSSRLVMVTASTLAAAIATTVGLVALLREDWLGNVWALPACYFVLSLAHGGVRVGRKTYVVDLGTGNRRTDYVAVSNSVIGVLLLVVGGMTSVVSMASVPATVLLLAGMGFSGAVMGLSLPEVE